LKFIGKRQLETRRFFWRLFEDKFNFPYHQFLTDLARRQQVLHACPEAFGPRCNGSPGENEGSLYERKFLQKGGPFHQFFKDNLAEFTAIDFYKESIDAYIDSLPFDIGEFSDTEPLEDYYILAAAVQCDPYYHHTDEHDGSGSDNDDDGDDSGDDDNTDRGKNVSDTHQNDLEEEQQEQEEEEIQQDDHNNITPPALPIVPPPLPTANTSEDDDLLLHDWLLPHGEDGDIGDYGLWRDIQNR
jgi:hypothetical protein